MKKTSEVSFGKLILSWQFLANCEDQANQRFLARQLLRLTPSEIGHGLMHPSGKQMLQKACLLAGIEYEDLIRDK